MAIDASSFRADFFIRTLNFATSFQVPNDVFEGIVRFGFSYLERLQIACVLREGRFNRFVDELGYAAISFSCFQAQCPMQGGVEIDGCSFLRLLIHRHIITPYRFNGKRL